MARPALAPGLSLNLYLILLNIVAFLEELW